MTEKASEISVPLLDLKAQYAPLAAEIMAAIEEVARSQYFILGPRVKELEERIASYSNSAHGVGVSSGTDALLLALMALGVGPGDEVLTSPYSFFATAGVVARLGARPVFCDIDPLTFNLSADAVRQCIADGYEHRGGRLVNKRTGGCAKVLMPVHLYGQTADMEPLLEIAREHGLKVVEDAAQAIGADYSGGRRAGSMGDIGCFSFFPSKNLGAFGDAGLCTTDDGELAERMRILRVHGSHPKYYHSLIGGNFRLDELQAAVLLVKLPHLDSWTAARQSNAAFYDGALASAQGEGKLERPHAVAGYRHIYNQYVIRTKNRDALRAHLTAARIGTEIYYPVSLHMQECFSYLGYAAADCPHAATASAETVALPIYPELTREQLEHTAASILSFYP